MRIAFTLGLLLLLAISGYPSNTQEIRIDADNEPLNSVLLKLREEYKIQFSYSDNLLSQHKITLHQTFESEEKAINKMLEGLPLSMKKSGNVYIIKPQKQKAKVEVKREPKYTKIIGQILEVGSYESLPFSHILINSHPLISDVNGSFTYTASSDPDDKTGVRLQISHLGYFIKDTTLYASANYQFLLTPSHEDLPEIIIRNNVVEKATLIGDKPGKMKLNNNISRFLPGAGDNAVFNLLRIMPGVLAAGEQSSDLLIWGSYASHSQLTFDGFTIFGLKNFNDNISTVNPFVTKNIEIFKGGYGAKYGNRVGGIVNIAGKNGNMQKPTFTANVNNTTLNGMVEIPLFKKSSLLIAYRQTYYNLFNTDDFNIFNPLKDTGSIIKNNGKSDGKGNSSSKEEITSFDFDVSPDAYQFRDMNLKYTWNFSNGDLFYISAYGGTDDFLMTVNTEKLVTRLVRKKIKQDKGKPIFKIVTDSALVNLSLHDTETNQQAGISAFYGKKWKNGNTSNLIASHSRLTNSVSQKFETQTEIGEDTRDLKTRNNEVYESSIRNENNFTLSNNHQIEFGQGVYQNGILYTTQKSQEKKDTLSFSNNIRAFAYAQYNVPLGKFGNLKPGIRLNHQLETAKTYLEPRLSVSFNLTNDFKLNASVGQYHQFLYKVARVDTFNNFEYHWQGANKVVQPLKARHAVAGINYNYKGFSVNLEGYYKALAGLGRRYEELVIIDNKEQLRPLKYLGSSIAKGMDLYIKQEFGSHSVWASYTLSKTDEKLENNFNRINRLKEQPSPHDQRHEFKIAGIFKLGSFYFGGDYVYGSGQHILSELLINEQDDIRYQRLDLSTIYKFKPRKINGELGLSVLNVLNQQNLKFTNMKRIPVSDELGSIMVYTNAVPFTPTLFLKVSF